MRITTAQQIKDIIEPISAEKFQTHAYGHFKDGWSGKNNGPEDNGCSCFLGHIHRHFDPTDGGARGDGDGYGARQLTEKFLREKHGVWEDGADVNNSPTVNGYNEPEIKDRVMHLINDMIAAGY